MQHEGKPAPSFQLNPNVTDFYQFTVDDIQLEHYEYWPLEDRIPVAE